MNPFTTVIADKQIPSHFSDPSAEYQKTVQCIGITNLSYRGRLELTGGDRVRFLHGQVTNDIKKLAPGDGCYAVQLNPKGKVRGDMVVWCLEDRLWLEVEPQMREATAQLLDRYIIADDVQLNDISTEIHQFSLVGKGAVEVLNRIFSRNDWPGQQHRFLSIQDARLGRILVAQSFRSIHPSYDVLVEKIGAQSLWNALLETVLSCGGAEFGWTVLECLRVEAGIPRMGAELDETVLPNEALLEKRAINYDKGCYIGQEVIARLRTYGHVNRELRGLLLDSHSVAVGGKVQREGRECGAVTSTLYSHALRQNVALAYIRRGTVPGETDVSIDGKVAKVVTLPFIKN